MPATTVQLCGRLVVSLDGRRVESALPGRQGRMLFAFLALHRDRPLGRAEVIDALWAGELPRRPSDALAAVLSKVRAAIGEQYLEGRGEIILHLPPDSDVDVERAVRAVHQAESACALADWPRAWSVSLAAQLVAERTLLGEYEAEWIDTWRRQLVDISGRALECYSRACLELGGTELAGAERTARQLVLQFPLRESGYGLLMAALEARGNVAEALRVYEALRVVLRDELGISPAADVHREYLRLLGPPGPV